MIDFRYHLVSVVAVFLALTVGLVLGSTVLQDPLLNTLRSESADLQGESEDLREERDDAERLNAGADQLAEAVAGDVLSGRLSDLGVVLVAAPGADEEAVRGLGVRIEEAGGEAVGRVFLEDAMLDGVGSTFVDELTLQVSGNPAELSGSPYDKAGAELGRALATEDDRADGDDGGDGADEGSDGQADGADDAADDSADDTEETDAEGSDPEHDAGAVLSAFQEGGLLAVEGSPSRSADALIVVAPSHTPTGDQETAHGILSDLTAALHSQIGPTVLAGDTASAGDGGLLAQVRAEEPPFTTVDVVGRPTGDVAAVLALADALEGPGAAYGLGEGVSGFLPDPLPGPVEPSPAAP
ncbi:copper transporter [Nocardiopsis nanhaiensis]